IITPAAGMKYGTLLHDLVPMAGLGFAMRSRVSLSLRPIPAATPQGVPAGIFLCTRAPPRLRHPCLPRPCLAEQAGATVDRVFRMGTCGALASGISRQEAGAAVRSTVWAFLVPAAADGESAAARRYFE